MPWRVPDSNRGRRRRMLQMRPLHPLRPRSGECAGHGTRQLAPSWYYLAATGGRPGQARLPADDAQPLRPLLPFACALELGGPPGPPSRARYRRAARGQRPDLVASAWVESDASLCSAHGRFGLEAGPALHEPFVDADRPATRGERRIRAKERARTAIGAATRCRRPCQTGAGWTTTWARGR
jgi:hypothetical protein